VLIVHHNDHDGRCSAAVVNHWAVNQNPMMDPRFLEVDYNMDFPMHEIQDGEDVWVVDFSLEPEVMKEVRKKAGVVTWIDHHATAAEYDYQDLAGIRDYSEKGPSGCELCWQHCFPDQDMPEAVNFIGDYDAWRHELNPASLEMFEGLKMEDTDPTSAIWQDLFSEHPTEMGRILDQGSMGMKYRDNYCDGMCESHGYETEIEGHKAYAANIYGFGSHAYGDKMQQYPICIAYIHNGKNFMCSLYSESVDVGEVCKKLGGGGHVGAAGFTCDKLPFQPVSEQSY